MLQIIVFCTIAASGRVPSDAQDRAPAAQNVERLLSALSAPRASDRSRAQRDLALELEPRDLAVLLAAARGGEAEVRRRISAAIASSDRHLGLAVGLASDGAGDVGDIGRDALRDMLARWSAGYADPGLDRAELRTKLRERSERVLSIDVDPKTTGFALLVDELARAADSAPPLVLDPDLLSSEIPAFRANTDLEGPFERVLDGVTRAYGTSILGFAFDSELGDAARPWILVAKRTDDVQRSAAERITEWCLAVASRAEPNAVRPSAAGGLDRRSSAAARALAALDWPAALAWLEQRWRADADADALEGVLLAAGRGRVAASLVETRVQEGLLRDIDAALRARTAAGDERAEAIGRALAAAGSSGPRGEDLASVALAQRELTPREMWMRLVVLEGARSSSPLVLPVLDALITLAPGSVAAKASPAEREALRFQALRTRAACARGTRLAGSVPDPRALFEWAAAKRAGDDLAELVRCLVIAGAPLPDEWRRPGGLPAEWRDGGHLDLCAAIVRWSIAEFDPAGDPESRGGSWIEDKDLSPAFVERVAVEVRAALRAGERDRVVRFLARARQARPAPSGAADALDRLELLSGCADSAAEQRVLAAATSSSRSDLLCLGAMAAGPSGDSAREALLRAARGTADPADLAAGLDRAVAELRGARDEKDERAFVTAVRDATRTLDPKVRALFRADLWPRAPASDIVRVSAVDRRLRTSGL